MKKTNNTTEINVLNPNARFTDFKMLHPIPTNCIIDKKLPDFGATHSELISDRHSILILPNVASIISKAEFYNSQEASSRFNLPNNYKVLAVHEKVTRKDVIAYLKAGKFNNKIVTTPEGFIKKVKPLLGDKLYTDYFLLIDESHKVTLDAGYRHAIVLPMEDFFKCNNKAMVSATSIKLSDPRFLEQHFKFLKVNPLFNYKKPLNVIHAKTSLFALAEYIYEHPSDNYCIFFNSIEGIKTIIEGLEIKDYRIFCSKESKELLKTTHESVASTFDHCATYNFFTSSFYNGLDIIITDKPKPEVIIISDMYVASHSAVDPLTDVPQIIGRFRDNYFNNLTHIVATKPSLIYLTEKEGHERISGSANIYTTLSTLKLSSNNTAVLNVLSEAMKRIKPYSYLINEDETINHFKLDNYFFEEKVKSSYCSLDTLKTAYAQSDHFDVTYLRSDVPYFKYPSGDEEKGKYSKLNYREVTDALFQLEEFLGSPWYKYAFNELHKLFPFIVTAFNNLGIDVLLKHEFNHRKIMQEVTKEHAERAWNMQPFIDAVYIHFRVGGIYLLSEIKTTLIELSNFHAITGKIMAETINRFFKVEPAKKKGQRAYKLIETLNFGKYNRA